jgi:hypothetical protein
MSHKTKKIILDFKKAKEKRENLANARRSALFYAEDKFYAAIFGFIYVSTNRFLPVLLGGMCRIGGICTDCDKYSHHRNKSIFR